MVNNSWLNLANVFECSPQNIQSMHVSSKFLRPLSNTSELKHTHVYLRPGHEIFTPHLQGSCLKCPFRCLSNHSFPSCIWSQPSVPEATPPVKMSWHDFTSQKFKSYKFFASRKITKIEFFYHYCRHETLIYWIYCHFPPWLQFLSTNKIGQYQNLWII
jgi:hypothetical protein